MKEKSLLDYWIHRNLVLFRKFLSFKYLEVKRINGGNNILLYTFQCILLRKTQEGSAFLSTSAFIPEWGISPVSQYVTNLKLYFLSLQDSFGETDLGKSRKLFLERSARRSKWCWVKGPKLARLTHCIIESKCARSPLMYTNEKTMKMRRQWKEPW